MQNRKRDTDICKTEKETQMYRTDFWTLWEKARVGCFKRTKHVYYLGWNRSPAQVWCMRQVLRPGALGRPRGIGWRGRWEGGSGWGIHVYPRLIHVNIWQKPLQYCKVISLQLIKINKFKKKRILEWVAISYSRGSVTKILAPRPPKPSRNKETVWRKEKRVFLSFLTGKRETHQAHVSRTGSSSSGNRERFYILMKFLNIFLLKLSNGHSSHHTTQQLSVMSLKLLVHDLSEIQNATRGYKGTRMPGTEYNLHGVRK